MRAVRLGLIAAIAAAVLTAVSALWNPVMALVPTLIFGFSAWGIRKGRAWGGYGAALFLVASGAGLLVGGGQLGAAATGVGLNLILAWILFRAGRALSAGGTRWPWIVVAVLSFAMPLLFHPYVIPTGAMEDTVLIGDRLLVREFALPAAARGRLVVVRYPLEPKSSFVKRVVAVGGDRLKIRARQLFVNGAAVPEPYVTRKTNFNDPFRDDFPQDPAPGLPGSDWPKVLKANTVNGELVIPPGKVFVMGDNRDFSLDSRYWGFLDPKDITGVPVIVYFSTDPAAGDATAPALLHPETIRWGRIFRIL